MHVVVAGSAGEVGSALASALIDSGHTVVNVSSRPSMATEGYVSNAEASSLILGGGVSLVINAAGPGDGRQDPSGWKARSRPVADACNAVGIPAVLLSTTRVMEGYTADYRESDPPLPTSDYGRANALSEKFWLNHAGARATVLRASNIFISPNSSASPQTKLLPWSLVIDGIRDRRIEVRSSAKSRKYFVTAADLVRATEVIFENEKVPNVLVTSPVSVFTLADLAQIAEEAVRRITGTRIDTSFGVSEAPSYACVHGWLKERGWQSHLSTMHMQEKIENWLTEWQRDL